MGSRILLKLVVFVVCATLILFVPCKTFHIATKIRHTRLCGKPLIKRVVSQCKTSGAIPILSEDRPYQRQFSFGASRYDQNELICCHGPACDTIAIAEKCDFW